MKAAFVQWLQQVAPPAGAHACAVRCADGLSASRSWSAGFSEASLENALRCVADLFQVMQHNNIAPGRVRWVYGDAALHCERRADGTCIGVFATRNDDALDTVALERLFMEFSSVGLPKASAA